MDEWPVRRGVVALIITRIVARVEIPTLEKVASINNFAGAEKTTEYGDRVRTIYDPIH